MRDAMLLGGMLSNSEAWINVTKADLTSLQKPDTFLQKELLSVSGNPRNAFMSLELGFIPVNYAIMYKRLAFLHYTKHRLKDHLSLPCTQSKNRRGDFYDQVVQDKKETNITFNKKYF